MHRSNCEREACAGPSIQWRPPAFFRGERAPPVYDRPPRDRRCLEVPSERGGASGYRGDKLVVRRFIENVASGRDVSVAHDALAPSYLNLAFEGIDIAGLKAMTTALHGVIGEARTSSLEMVA